MKIEFDNDYYAMIKEGFGDFKEKFGCSREHFIHKWKYFRDGEHDEAGDYYKCDRCHRERFRSYRGPG